MQQFWQQINTMKTAAGHFEMRRSLAGIRALTHQASLFDCSNYSCGNLLKNRFLSGSPKPASDTQLKI